MDIRLLLKVEKLKKKVYLILKVKILQIHWLVLVWILYSLTNATHDQAIQGKAFMRAVYDADHFNTASRGVISCVTF